MFNYVFYLGEIGRTSPLALNLPFGIPSTYAVVPSGASLFSALQTPGFTTVDSGSTFTLQPGSVNTLALVPDASGGLQLIHLPRCSWGDGVTMMHASASTTMRAAGLAVLLACGGGESTAPAAVTAPVTQPTEAEMPISGTAVPGMASYDQVITAFMRKLSIPGGAVAVMRDGKLVYARGFGYADVEHKTPVRPDALFRIASVSKTITAAAIMTLVEDGRLTLDERVAPLIAHLAPAPGATVDARWEQITIRHLLNHAGGWDRERPGGGFDPIDRPAIAAAAVGAPAPASPETLIRYMKGIPLDFDPGARWAYSNFGYILLGRVIERVSGVRYEDYVRARVLQPVGAMRTRQGRSRMADAVADEVKYYSPPSSSVNALLVPSVFPGAGLVPLTYGGFHLEVSDASGAWLSSTIDLLRLVGGIDGSATRPDILSAALVQAMTGSGPAVCPGGACYYGAGWFVRPTGGNTIWWHGGSMPGATAMLVRPYDNVVLIGLFNGRTVEPINSEAELDAALAAALKGVTSFPSHDLFPAFR